jgi:integrase
VARKLGKIRPRGAGFQVEVWHEGTRYRIGAAPIGGHWTALRSVELAEMVLAAIRSDVASGAPVEVAVAPFLRRPTAATLVSTKLAAYLARERERAAAGQLSPLTLRELERYAKPGGAFAPMLGLHVFAVRYGHLDDWRAQLAAKHAPKTVANVLGAFRAFLAWVHRRGEIVAVPPFPTVELDEHVPTIIDVETQDRVLAAIPWERRGIFLALAHSVRPGEARALDLVHYQAGDLLIRRAVKGPEATAPVATAKERNWRVIGCDERLVAWIEGRLARASAAERLQREGVPLFPRPDGRPGRWSHWMLWSGWQAACTAVGVEVGLYEGTKHATATDLLRRGEPLEVVQRFLGHRERRSTERYARLADRTVADTLRRGRL